MYLKTRHDGMNYRRNLLTDLHFVHKSFKDILHPVHFSCVRLVVVNLMEIYESDQHRKEYLIIINGFIPCTFVQLTFLNATCTGKEKAEVPSAQNLKRKA